MKLLKNIRVLSHHSLLSNTEFNIDGMGNIGISKHSLIGKETSSIPLDLISPEPMVEHKIKVHHLAFSLISLFAGITFLSLSHINSLVWLNVMSGIFILFSSLSFAFALNNKETIYSFFFENTNTKAFSITDDQTVFVSSDKAISQCEAFIQNLRKDILNKGTHYQTQNFKSNDDKYLVLKEKLDEIYNYGVVNETLYKIIEDNITDKIFGLDHRKTGSQGNVIAFQAKKELIESA